MTATVGLMGFGRIGRNIFRILHARDDIEVVAISDIADHSALEYLLRFDTVLGRFPDPVHIRNGVMTAGRKKIRMLSGEGPGDVDWKEAGADYVIVATAKYRSRAELAGHLDAGAKHVIVCTPCRDEPDITVIYGVNDERLTKEHRIISNGSCTSAAAGPVIGLLHEKFGIRQGFLTTVHAYTNDLRLADVPSADRRRSRSAAENVIPTDTRAHEMIMDLIPDLAGRLGGEAVNVPVPDGSVADIVVQTDKPVEAAEVNELMRNAALGRCRAYLEYEDDPIVSSDVIGNPHSGIFDSLATQVLGSDFLRVLVWFDNGWGYAHRAVDLVAKLSGQRTGVEVSR